MLQIIVEIFKKIMILSFAFSVVICMANSKDEFDTIFLNFADD